MPEWNEDMQHFMRYWFAGLEEGLANIDEPARKTILRACGKACARSYTAELFQKTWKDSNGLEDFLENLSTSFPEGHYEKVGPGQIYVRYERCACDLILHKLVTSPLLCDCSAQNLESNFTSALGRPVSVTLETSILRGSDHCEFLVVLEDEF